MFCACVPTELLSARSHHSGFLVTKDALGFLLWSTVWLADSMGDGPAMAASIAAEIRRRVQQYSKSGQAPPKALGRPSPAVFIDQYSTADDVSKWLAAKGFQPE